MHTPTKVAIVTGGTRGIGYAIAEELLNIDYHVIICSRKANRPDNLVFPVNNDHSYYFSCDISKKSERKSLLEYIQTDFNRLDVLVNNAGVAPDQRLDILQTTEESFDKVLKINLYGAFFLSQMCANYMIRNKTNDQSSKDGQAMIINISSISAFTSSPNRGEYCISKAGMTMMTKLFADRLAEHHIPVFEIQPGIIKTDMTAKVEEKYTKLIDEGLLPIKRWGLPEDIGKTVKALVTGALPYSTGQILHIDGGFHLHRL